MTGVPELLLLRLLSREQMYGYQLVRQVQLVTGEAISLGEGVIYPMLHGLEKSGYLSAERKQVGARSRVYYSATPKGGKRLETLEKEWQRISGAVALSAGAA
ncbi:MAG: PadR family transcriptional regulator [Pseudomonadota bacterium]